MATVQASWLHKGYFVLRDDGLMRDVRDILEKSLRLRKGSLSVRMYPEDQAWKHTVWWREAREPFVEAQFVAQIARGYPVLSLGVAVEKGYGSIKVGKTPIKRMNRSWDWHRLIANAERFLIDVEELDKRFKIQPLTLRVTVTPASGRGSKTTAYSFVNGVWYERYVGHATPRKIVQHLRNVDGMDDHWAIVHVACDLSPKEIDGWTARKLASTLIKFNAIRRRLRGLAP
jgi:hypothetical protein